MISATGNCWPSSWPCRNGVIGSRGPKNLFWFGLITRTWNTSALPKTELSPGFEVPVRYLLQLLPLLLSWFPKYAALSRQFQGEDKTTNGSDSIPLIPCGVSVLTWEVEERVRSATEGQSGPSACPPNRFCSPSPEVRCHPVGPHPIQRVGDVFLQWFWWSREFVNACPVYNQHKPSSQAAAGFLQTL